MLDGNLQAGCIPKSIDLDDVMDLFCADLCQQSINSSVESLIGDGKMETYPGIYIYMYVKC